MGDACAALQSLVARPREAPEFSFEGRLLYAASPCRSTDCAARRPSYEAQLNRNARAPESSNGPLPGLAALVSVRLAHKQAGRFLSHSPWLVCLTNKKRVGWQRETNDCSV